MKDFERFARLLADESAKIVRRYFRTPISVEQKPDESPVTIADKKAEEVMRELIAKEFSDHGVIGEGENDFDAIFKELKSVNFDGWISIEDGENGIEELRASVGFLRAKMAEHWGA